MVVQYKVPTIVMLTKIEERNPHNPSQLVVNFVLIFTINFWDLTDILVEMLSLFSNESRSMFNI